MTIAERITESAKHLDALLVILEEAEPRTRASAAARAHYDKEANRLMHELFRGQSDEGQYEIIHALHNARKSAWRLRHWIASAELVDAIPAGDPCTVEMPPCKHPNPYAWYAYDDTLCLACTICGEVLKGGVSL